MQLAALAAVVSYFWTDVSGLTGGAIAALKRRDYGDWSLRFCIWIGLATLPIIIAGSLLSKLLNTCNSPLRSLAAIGVAYIVMGVLLALAEIYSRHKRTLDHVDLKDAMIVGLAQCGALIPGVSRSGSTFTAALFRDLERTEAARFSFLLGIPAIAAAGLKELYELHKAHLEAHGWSILAVGLVVASISAFVAIWGLLRILERFATWPFVIYRVGLGIFLLVAVFAHWLPN
jgi:undecaprenyl-diphosphatase